MLWFLRLFEIVNKLISSMSNDTEQSYLRRQRPGMQHVSSLSKYDSALFVDVISVVSFH